MFNTTKIKIVAGLAGSAILLSSGVAFAENSTKPDFNEGGEKFRTQMQENKEERENAREERKEEREEKKEERCNVVEGRIQNKLSKFQENKENHVERYKHIKEAVTNLVARLKEKGYSTGNLETYLKELDSKIQDMASDYQTFISKLEETKNYTCGASQGDFVAKLNEAKAARIVVFQDAVEIRKYIIETIRPEMKSLREQIKDSKSSENQ